MKGNLLGGLILAIIFGIGMWPIASLVRVSIQKLADVVAIGTHAKMPGEFR